MNLGLMTRLKAAIGGMTTNQKIITIAIAIMIPLGVWCGAGFPTSATSLGELAAAEISALVAALGIIFGVSPPAQ